MDEDHEPVRGMQTCVFQHNTPYPNREAPLVSANTNADNNPRVDVADEDRPWTERHTVNNQYLSTLEAASLIVNKMIGTGIFTTPGLILFLTQNKALALSLWVIGGIYAAMW
jgi:hypothetical protein